VARSELFIAASPPDVFAVISDPRTYGYWVPGSRRIRAADPEWPAPGTALDHEVGLAPLALKDSTHVVESQEPEMIELRAHARPMPPARVRLRFEPEGNGTLVTMIEEPASRLLSVLISLPGHAILRVRNRESLRRLKALAEGTAKWPEGELPPRDSPAGDADSDGAARTQQGRS
jgi:hypothetical protein